jgi:hypothetical protein
MGEGATTSRQPRGWQARSPNSGWANRQRFYPRLTSLDEAVEKTVAVGRDLALPALAFADVADNPGGGGRGNTTFLLRAFHEAGVAGALLGVFFGPKGGSEVSRIETAAASSMQIVIRAADPYHAANLPSAPRGVSASPEVSGTSSKPCASPREAASPFAVSSAPSHGRVPLGSVQPTMTIPCCAGI